MTRNTAQHSYHASSLHAMHAISDGFKSMCLSERVSEGGREGDLSSFLRLRKMLTNAPLSSCLPMVSLKPGE